MDGTLERALLVLFGLGRHLQPVHIKLGVREKEENILFFKKK
jgi:hypothetical protein